MTGWLSVPPADEVRVKLAPEIGPVLFLTITVRFDTLADLRVAGLAVSVELGGGMITPKAESCACFAPKRNRRSDTAGEDETGRPPNLRHKQAPLTISSE